MSHSPETMFGAIAIELGYATDADIDRALEEQQRVLEEEEEEKRIGVILIEQGVISPAQLNDVLRLSMKRRRGKQATSMILDSGDLGAIESRSRSLERRIAELEQLIAERDAEIAALRAQLGDGT